MPTRRVFMPEVDNLPADKLERIFKVAHAASLGKQPNSASPDGQRNVALLSPGRMMRQFLAPVPNSMSPDLGESMRQILPLPSKRVVAIGCTADLMQADIDEISAAIPFFGFLIGLAYIGHSVVLFEGHPLAFEAGIRGADMLLVDRNITAFLPSRWTETAFRVMRTPEVNVYNADDPQISRVQRIINPTANPYNRSNLS